MKWPFVVLGLLAVLATAQSASAQELLLIESTSHVDISTTSGRENMALHYVVSQTGENALRDSIYIYGAVSDVNVSDTDGALFHSENVEGSFTVVAFNLRETLNAGDRSTVTVEFTRGTSLVGADYRYEIRYLWKTTPSSSHVIAALPQGYTLHSTSENASSTFVSDGKLQLLWAQVQENQFFTSITFSGPPTSSENQEGGQPAVTSSLLYALLLAAAAASLTVAAVFIKIRMPEPEVKAPKGVMRPRMFSMGDVRRMMLMLTPHERKVINVLLKKDNLTQRALCDRTGIPKATMSRVLQRLENKGVVSRSGYGVSKRVLLTKWARRWKT